MFSKRGRDIVRKAAMMSDSFRLTHSADGKHLGGQASAIPSPELSCSRGTDILAFPAGHPAAFMGHTLPLANCTRSPLCLLAARRVTLVIDALSSTQRWSRDETTSVFRGVNADM